MEKINIDAAVADLEARQRDREAQAEQAELVDQFEKLARERIPRRYRNATADHPGVLAWVDRFVADPVNAPSLLLLGPTGTGKTHQAYGALRAVATRTYAAIWIACTTADMLADLRPHPGEDSEATMRRYRRVPLLLLDDLGAVKHSEWVEETLYRVLDGRYAECQPCILTSNLPVSTFRDAIGDRIASRLAETCTRVVLDGVDRRRTAAG